MDFDSTYKWVLVYGYYAALVMLVITGAQLTRRRSGFLSIVCLLGFVASLAGSLLMMQVRGDLIEFETLVLGSSGNRELWQIGRAMSSIGLFTGSLALMLLQFFRR